MDANAMQSMSSQFGIINSLRTGNVVFDMLICMMIPVFFKVLTVVFEKFQPAFQAFLDGLRNNKNVVIKTLDYEFRMNAWGSVQRAGKEERNNILQKALTLFIAEIKDLKLETSKISFMAVKEKGKRDNDSYEMVYGGTAEQLAMYSINTLPPNAVWIELKKGLQFRQSVIEPNNEGENKITKMTIRFEFKGDNPDGEKKINEFVQEAFDWYVEKMKSLADHSRYLYMLVKSPPSASSEDSGGGDDAPTRVYKRYKLSDEKSFTCLFFREKQMLLKLLSHFKEKTGKYAIQGFPHKLGLLLHGPPGTGKTSLIKAMAQHTGRNVVSVPLARIETNQELMDIVFDQSFAVKGEDMPIKLSFKDIIFVMEDVDAASPIVHSRSGDKSGDSTTKVILEKAGGDHGPEKVELTKQVSNSAAETSSAGVGGDMVDLGEGGDAGLMMAMLSSVMDSGSGDKKGLDYKSSKYMSKYDKLDLSGLLNVLDGVVDCPNRILIMTTNHPEKLDPALIRPGRIDKIIYLGYLQAPEAKEMVEHYFGDELTTPQWNRLEAALGSPPGMADFTPAEVEQLCAEYDEVDEFLTALEERVLDECEKNMQKTQLHTSASTLSRHDDMPPPAPLKRGLSTTSKVSNVSK